MKIKDYSETLTEKMSEFDMWVTPSLGEIRDTEQFKKALQHLKIGFDNLAAITENYRNYNNCSSNNLAQRVIEFVSDDNKSDDEINAFLESVCNVLLLSTGKTDNNLKCQFPLILRNTVGLTTYPVKARNGIIRDKELPRSISSGDVCHIMIGLRNNKDYGFVFLESYFHLIISDELYAKQLWSLGNAYILQKNTGNEDALLSSLVVFQSRGSITATQGHIPETILRRYMSEWGLRSNFDFNTQDVEVGEILGDIPVDNKIKKRKYDFIIPFQSRENGKKIFIQSQFYAGDSGSVSHKVVDQTDATREATLKKYTDAIFIEYLDGAGYFASLNGDLRKMLAKTTTKDFIQIRTAPIKLRRALQGIQFLTPLEIEHAIVRTAGDSDKIISLLKEEEYSEEEICTALKCATEAGVIVRATEHKYCVKPERVEIIRKYCLLDTIANYGSPIPVGQERGSILVAGFSTYWGLPQNEVIRKAKDVFPGLSIMWGNVQTAFDDIQDLIYKGFIILK